MSYTKTNIDIAGLDPAVAAVMTAFGIDQPDAQAKLLEAGQSVQLETGDTIWVSCIAHDDPATSPIEFLVMAMRATEPGPSCKANGQPVAVASVRSVWPELVAAWTIPVIRKACMMLALGEPQPQVDKNGTMTDVFELGSAEAANGCIRTQINLAAQIAAGPTDVL